MSGPVFVRNRSLLGGGSLILLAIGLWPGSRSKDQGKSSPKSGSSDASRGRTPGRPAARDPEARRHERAKATEEEERQHREVMDLADKLREKADEAMKTEGEYPWYLMMECVPNLTRGQLELLVRTISRDSSIPAPNRAMIVGVAASSWMHDAGKWESTRVRMALDLLYETRAAVDEGPSGLNVPMLLFAFCSEGAEVNPEPFVDFATEHWEDWPQAEDFRASLQDRMKDQPVESARLRGLPGR